MEGDEWKRILRKGRGERCSKKPWLLPMQVPRSCFSLQGFESGFSMRGCGCRKIGNLFIADVSRCFSSACMWFRACAFLVLHLKVSFPFNSISHSTT